MAEMEIRNLDRTAARYPPGSGCSRRIVRAPAVTLLALVAAFAFSSAAPAQMPPQSGESSVYTVLLASPSVGERLREPPSKGGSFPAPRSQAGMVSMRRAVARAQDPVINDLESRGFEVLGSVRNVLNAVFVRASPEQAEAIGAMQGIAGVSRGRRYEPMLKSVSEIVRVSSARVRISGFELYGDGLKIAIIDSGLDFDHEAFEDGSLAALAGYPKGDPEYISLASPKVVAVRSYVESLNSKSIYSSSPDDYSPWDVSGHGTAVAMIAAGRRIETAVGAVSGIAPNARIGVYKVFGSPGLNFYTADHVVIMAIEDAVADGMDVLNLSLGNPTYYAWNASGSDCGRSSSIAPCDPLVAAAQSAVEDFGRVVVVAAGNYGLRGSHSVPARTTINSPGDAPFVITVGETGNAVVLKESVRIGELSFEASSGTGPDADGPLTAPAALASEFGDRLACAPFPEKTFLGRIAVIDRSECFFVTKVEHADAAGAAGVLVINHEGDDLVEMALLEDTDIPAFFVGGTDGAAIREAISEMQVPLTLDPTPNPSEQDWQFVAPQSSHGPTLSLHPKPDLVAPGLNVYTASPRYNDEGILFTPGGFRAVSGTSFAAPVVSGAAALVWQSFPSLTARQVSSALINSAKPLTLEDGELAPLAAAGAGALDIHAALRPTALMVPPSIGFGSILNSPFPIRRMLSVTNKSSRPQAFLLLIEPQNEDPNARLTIDGRQAAVFRLAANATTELEIALAGSRPQPGLYEGRLRLISLSGQGEVFVPYLFVLGDSEPFNSIQFQGRSDVGIAGEEATKSLVARVLDQYGAPVTGRPVSFRAAEGSPSILRSSPTSGPTGLIFATVRYEAEPGQQSVVAEIGDLEITFSFEASGSKPVIRAIANSASLASSSGIAAGSLATIDGGQFAAFPSGLADVPQVRPLPISRKGVTVAFDAPERDVSVAGRVYFADESSVIVQVPWELAGAESAYVSVRAGNRTAPFEFDLVAADPGIFSYQLEGQSYAMALHSDGTQVTADAPARHGEAVTISMTGNGPVRSPPATGTAGDMLAPTLSTPDVRIGGLPGDVTYSGLGPGMAGLYLVTVVIPEMLVPGDHSVQVSIGRSSSNEALLPVE